MLLFLLTQAINATVILWQSSRDILFFFFKLFSLKMKWKKAYPSAFPSPAPLLRVYSDYVGLGDSNLLLPRIHVASVKICSPQKRLSIAVTPLHLPRRAGPPPLKRALAAFWSDDRRETANRERGAREQPETWGGWQRSRESISEMLAEKHLVGTRQ